jgi:GNAT superfamily N-acetyltransferase
MSDTRIRALTEHDREAWLPLWADYCSFYRHEPVAEATEAAFGALHRRERGMAGLVAERGSGSLVGFAHLLFHPSTWSPAPYCYLEDLWVARDARGGGVAHALFDAVYELARERRAARVYWHTQAFNAPARSLYDQVGSLTSMVVYEREL